VGSFECGDEPSGSGTTELDGCCSDVIITHVCSHAVIRE
jgi:hypothetical protein